MSIKATCSDCGVPAPPGDDNSTLISVKHGWRLSREPAANGETTFRWRCAECWRKHKERTGASSSGEHSGIIAKVLAAAWRRKA